jgi:hypothetical protein|tara:strand:+ start:738 stop:908 length:171 start_codon:yes stop_codon:yes gene_type:complete
MATSKKKTTKKATKKVAKKETLDLPEGWIEYDGKAFSSERKIESYKRRLARERGEA